MNAVRAFLEGVSDQVWGALVGAVIALVGVFLANRHARKQLSLQLAHDARERDKERSMALRRDVFMEAAGAMTKLSVTLGRLVEIDTNEQGIGTELSGQLATIHKVHIVGNYRTIEASMSFAKVATTALAGIMKARMPLRFRKSDIDIAQKYHDVAVADSSRYIELMRQANLDGNVEPALWRVLSDGSADAQKRMRERQEELDRLRSEQLEQQFTSFIPEFLVHMGNVARTLPGAVVAVRAELDLPIEDEAEYQRLIETFMAETHSEAEATVQAIDRTFKEAMSK